MAGRVFILIASLLTICQADVTVRISASDTLPQVGDDVTLTCYVTNKPESNFWIRWLRRIGNSDTELAINSVVNAPYKDRYSADYVDMGSSEGSFRLNISDFAMSDIGQIGCSATLAGVEDFIELHLTGSYATDAGVFHKALPVLLLSLPALLLSLELH